MSETDLERKFVRRGAVRPGKAMIHQFAFEQSHGVMFILAAYFAENSLTIGSVTVSSAVYQSEQPLIDPLRTSSGKNLRRLGALLKFKNGVASSLHGHCRPLPAVPAFIPAVTPVRSPHRARSQMPAA